MITQRVLALLSMVTVAGGICLAQSEAAGELLPRPVEEANVHGTQPAIPSEAAPPRQLSPMKRGDILMARKMYREAIEVYQGGIKDAAIIYNKIGIAYHQLADFKAALANYNMALRLNPNYAEAINNIGTVYYAQQNPKRAIKEYRKALKYAPKSASIYSNLGTAQFSRRKYKEAFEAYQKAIELDPNVFEHRNTAGSLLQERSVKERAKFHFYLAKTYAKQGMADRALEYIRKALEEGFKDRRKFQTDPDFASLQENEEFQTLMAMEPRVL